MSQSESEERGIRVRLATSGLLSSRIFIDSLSMSALTCLGPFGVPKFLVTMTIWRTMGGHRSGARLHCSEPEVGEGVWVDGDQPEASAPNHAERHSLRHQVEGRARCRDEGMSPGVRYIRR